MATMVKSMAVEGIDGFAVGTTLVLGTRNGL